MRTKGGSIAALVILAIATFIFLGIVMRFELDPARASARQGLVLENPFAFTTVRVGFGAFPLAGAIVAVAGLVSSSRRRDALRFVAIVFALGLGVRIFSVIVDHAGSPLNTRLIVIETIVLAGSLIVLWFDRSLAERVGFEPTVRD